MKDYGIRVSVTTILDQDVSLNARGWDCVSIAQRSDGYTFLPVFHEDEGFKVKAGCQWMTIAEYKKHTKIYGGPLGRRKRKETLAILALFEMRIKTPLQPR